MEGGLEAYLVKQLGLREKVGIGHELVASVARISAVPLAEVLLGVSLAKAGHRDPVDVLLQLFGEVHLTLERAHLVHRRMVEVAAVPSRFRS